jgi:hypothetical protein
MWSNSPKMVHVSWPFLPAPMPNGERESTHCLAAALGRICGPEFDLDYEQFDSELEKDAIKERGRMVAIAQAAMAGHPTPIWRD